MRFVNLWRMKKASFKAFLMSQRSSTTMSKRQKSDNYTCGNKSTILIYGGEGSCEDSRKLCYDALVKVVDSTFHPIRYISQQEIKEGSWTTTCCLIVFGGGYDLGFINALGSKGTHIIREFVQHGGSYLGICAGAYWACNDIEFDKGGQLEVVGERFLKFYPGSCIGPAYPGFDYKDKKGVHAVPVSYKGIMFRSYLHGGGFFTLPSLSLENEESTLDSTRKRLIEFQTYDSTVEIPHITAFSSSRNTAVTNSLSGSDKRVLSNFASQKTQVTSNIPLSAKNSHGKGSNKSSSTYISNHTKGNYEILGSFTSLNQTPGAFVKCSVGRGKAVLSAVHVEFPAALLDQDHPNLEPVVPVLRDSEAARDFVFRHILLQVHVRLTPPKSLL